MFTVVILDCSGNDDKKSLYIFSMNKIFFLYVRIFSLWLVDSTDAEPTNMEGRHAKQQTPQMAGPLSRGLPDRPEFLFCSLI
jgi:hypothetical protein